MPTRYLKPGICDSANIDAIACPEAEILYYRLLVTVDDFGRFDARPALVRAKCFPLKEGLTSTEVDAWLVALHAAQMIWLYEVGGARFLQVQRWDNKPRAGESKFPPVPTDADGCIQVCAFDFPEDAGVEQNQQDVHLHTDVCNPRTVLPVTVTGTKTETETETTPPEKKVRAKPNPLDAYSALPEVPAQVVKDWLQVRKDKGAKSLTETGLADIRREASKAGLSMEDALTMCCRRNWIGFEAAWVKTGNGQGSPPNGKTAKQSEAERFFKDLRGNHGNDSGATIDGIAERVASGVD